MNSQNKEILNTLVLSASLSISTILIGTFGYIFLLPSENDWIDALYMTIITLSTVGFGEIIDLSLYPKIRIFTIILIIFGVGNLLFLYSSINAFFTDTDFQKNLRRKRLMKKINKLKNHFILCGTGNVGSRIVSEIKKFSKIRKNKIQVVGIEKDPEIIKKIKETLPNLPLIEGDATDEVVLRQAGIDKAEQVICTLNDDRDNILLTVMTKKISPSCRVISKAKNLDSKERLLRVGADSVISPQFIGALRMAWEILSPNSIYLIDKMIVNEKNHRLQEISIPNKSPFISKTVDQLQIHQLFGMPIIAIKNKNQEINFQPHPKDVIKTKDTLLAIASHKQVLCIQLYLSTGKFEK